MKKTAWIVLTIIVLLVPAFAGAGLYTSVVSFGDSLTDNGNLKTFVTLINDDYAQYIRERYTDDKVWVEYFTESIGAQLENHAYAGATTDGHQNETLDPLYGDQLGLLGQVSTYLSETTPDSDALVTIWIGGNDMLDLPLETSTDLVSSTVANAMDNIETVISDLVEAGTRDFLIPNLPDLGKIPLYNAIPTATTNATAAAQTYNDALSGLLQTLESRLEKETHANIVIYQLDVFSLLNSVIAQGVFVNNIDAWVDADEGASVADYLFWDDRHPTSGGHKLVATAVEELVVGNSQDGANEGVNGDDDQFNCFITSVMHGIKASLF